MKYSLRASLVAKHAGVVVFVGKERSKPLPERGSCVDRSVGGRTGLIDVEAPPDELNFQVLSGAGQKLNPQCAVQQLQTLEAVFSDAGLALGHVDVCPDHAGINYHSWRTWRA